MSTTPPSQPPIEDFELRMPDDLSVDHCYRHPDRETGVHCANCGRPICHDCMTPAAVGFRCPECMAEQRRSTGRAQVVTRQQTRGRWQSGALGSRGMSATKVLIGVNVVIFLLQQLGTFGSELTTRGGLAPAAVIIEHQYYRMITTMFLHASITHIFFNMLALWFLGEFAEQVLGSVKFVVLYFVSGLVGSLFVLYYSPPAVLTIGASGAIAGVFGALLAYAFLFRHRDYIARAIFGQLVFWFVLNLVINLYDRALSWQGHLGGLIGGIVLMAAYTQLGRRAPSARFSRGDIVVTAIVLIAVVVLSVWRVQTSSLVALLPWP